MTTTLSPRVYMMLDQVGGLVCSKFARSTSLAYHDVSEDFWSLERGLELYQARRNNVSHLSVKMEMTSFYIITLVSVSTVNVEFGFSQFPSINFTYMRLSFDSTFSLLPLASLIFIPFVSMGRSKTIGSI
ncbi:hypothetical protein DFH29DRAFT_930627 [Suillus ampliporus]|nr:hypothetical protein DFH29DRAFT_930627 [Suillus ampliporus]